MSCEILLVNIKKEPLREEHDDDMLLIKKEVKPDPESDCTDNVNLEPANRTEADLKDLYLLYEGHKMKEEMAIGPEEPIPLTPQAHKVWCNGNERVLKLIELYQNYECLWDTAHREYKNKLKKQDAWDSIAKTLDVPVKEVESKVHTLRSQFTRERKKLKCSKKTGSGSEDVVNITWFAYEPLLFLIKGETTTGNKDTIENHVEDNNSTQHQNEDNSTQHQNEEARADQTETIRQTGTKVAKKRSPDEKVDETYEIMRNVKKRLEDRDKMTDDFDVYGKYVASELRNIKDEYSTLIAKQYINNILIDARIGKYRQEYNTYGYNTGRRSTPGTSTTSTSNDGTTNQDSVQQNNDEDVVDFELPT